VIACGGAGSVNHIHDVIINGKADAVNMASILHYNFIKEHDVTGDFSSEGNIEYLQSRRDFSKIQTVTIPQIKSYLIKNNIECRHPIKSGMNV
jgi:cyclase